ncbi:phosphotransferase [Paenibacillus chibensis]|uniref:phosphotransferase n=1 Tax=Paenibacillus chibensis TaxID=59846 RepID=UPI000FDAB4B4|nr:phosphotransferase [Paenibacillus chibensis]MEC0372831.1 phosphotransferase [Paenibacillus chibensis]
MGKANIWDADWEVSKELAGRLIFGQFPQLAGKPLRLLGYGWDNTVYAVGNEFTFRFPRRKIAVNLLEMEGRILPQLEEYIDIPYSKPLFFGQASEDFPSPFLGYTYLEGTFPIGLTDEQRLRSASSLARFLKGLHAFPVAVARAQGAQQDHRNLIDIASRKERMLGFLGELKVHLTADEVRVIESYLRQITLDQASPREVFMHGDLHFKNMLVDGTGGISGIIDWGDMNIGHPGCDLNIAYSFVPPQARAAFFQEYGAVDEETKILARMIAVYIPMLILIQSISDNDESTAKEAKAVIFRALIDEDSGQEMMD